MRKSILTIISFIGVSFCQIEYGGSPIFFDSRSLDINIIYPDASNIIDRNFNPMVFEYGFEYEMDIDFLEEAIVI